jgi:hypothetical protein
LNPPLLWVGTTLLAHVVEGRLGEVKTTYGDPHRLVTPEGQPDGKEFLASPVSLALFNLGHMEKMYYTAEPEVVVLVQSSLGQFCHSKTVCAGISMSIFTYLPIIVLLDG